ncbi:MAG TPA: MarR family transcriptional regulator [Rhizobium sp.]|nr:MarR family transcriptional regulator [Rhizobium sp.]
MSRQIGPDPVEPEDHVERRRAQWRAELPDVDTRGMAILGRARWITLKVRPAIEAVFARHDLDAGEFDVLSTLRRSGPPYRLRPTELFTQLMISSGGLTNRLIRLQRAGLIERPASDADGRSLPVQLTALGRETVEDAFREDMAVEARLLKGLSEAELKELARLLAKLAEGMDGG